MKTIDLGKVSITPRGAYGNEVAYHYLDLVSYKGSSFLVLKDCTGITPAEGEYYMVMAEKSKATAGESVSSSTAVDAVVSGDAAIKAGELVYMNSPVGPMAEMPVGHTILLTEDGEAKKYVIVHQGLPSDLYDESCNGTWICREDIYAQMAWGSSNSFIYSTMIEDMQNLVAKLDPSVQSAVKTVKIPYGIGNASDEVNSGAEGFECQVFPLSANEIMANSSTPADGVILSYFCGTPLGNRLKAFSSVKSAWATRSPSKSDTTNVASITAAGDLQMIVSTTNTLGVVPVMILDSSLYVKSDGTVTTEEVEYNRTVIPAGENIPNGIALVDAEAGAPIQILQNGVAFAPWVTKYMTIGTNYMGVRGYGLENGMLVASYGTKYPGNTNKILFTKSEWTGSSGNRKLVIPFTRHGMTNDDFVCLVRHNVNGVYKMNTWGSIAVDVTMDPTTMDIVLSTADEAIDGSVTFVL